MKEAVDDIMVTLNEAASEVGMVGGMVDLIAEAMTKVSIETDPFLTLCLKADPLQSFGQTSTISVVSHEMLSQETWRLFDFAYCKIKLIWAMVLTFTIYMVHVRFPTK